MFIIKKLTNINLIGFMTTLFLAVYIHQLLTPKINLTNTEICLKMI